MKFFKRNRPPGKSFFSMVKTAIDLRDIHVYGGISLIGYGLYQYEPFVSFLICGFILMLLGLGWLDRGGG